MSKFSLLPCIWSVFFSTIIPHPRACRHWFAVVDPTRHTNTWQNQVFTCCIRDKIWSKTTKRENKILHSDVEFFSFKNRASLFYVPLSLSVVSNYRSSYLKLTSSFFFHMACTFSCPRLNIELRDAIQLVNGARVAVFSLLYAMSVRAGKRR